MQSAIICNLTDGMSVVTARVAKAYCQVVVRKCGMANSPTSDSAIVAWQEISGHIDFFLVARSSQSNP